MHGGTLGRRQLDTCGCSAMRATRRRGPGCESAKVAVNPFCLLLNACQDDVDEATAVPATAGMGGAASSSSSRTAN
eukprot:7915998-Pyramimonas_sp.AAC.1